MGCGVVVVYCVYIDLWGERVERCENVLLGLERKWEEVLYKLKGYIYKDVFNYEVRVEVLWVK